jgi:hypothetical protein
MTLVTSIHSNPPRKAKKPGGPAKQRTPSTIAAQLSPLGQCAASNGGDAGREKKGRHPNHEGKEVVEVDRIDRLQRHGIDVVDEIRHGEVQRCPHGQAAREEDRSSERDQRKGAIGSFGIAQ